MISDGAAGLIGAVERTMGAALRQRCLIHRGRNVLAKVPKNAQAEVKADYWAIFDLPEEIEPGPRRGRVRAEAGSTRSPKRWRDSYPAAVRCLLADRDSLTVYLRFPREHWTRVRHSNFIERTFGETRRRVKVIGRLPGEHSCLQAGVGGARPCLGRLARVHHDPRRAAAAAGPAPHRCTTRLPDCRNGIRKFTPKPAWRQPIPSPSHRITNRK